MSEKHLPGAGRYLAPTDDRARFEERDALVTRANDSVDLRDMLNELGADIPEGTGTSWKTYCPFGIEHEDGGISKALRYYAESNSAMCFATHGVLTPVRLLSMTEGISQHKAAQRLAGPSRFGWRERVRELQADAYRPRTGSPAFAVTALTVRLKVYPTYVKRQFDEDFRTALEARIEALGDVASDFDSLNGWVEASVEVLAPLLESE